MANPTIYDRSNAEAPWERLLFRPDRILQSAEMNEVQTLLRGRVRGIAEALFADGDVVRAAGIVVDAASGATVCEAGAIYADGAVRGVPPASISIPVAGAVHVGVYLRADTLTEIDDPLLLNPAAGTRGYGQPGAARERIVVSWGHQGDGQAGDFYPIWLVEDGIVRPKDPPPTLSAVTQALARYDRDSAGGTYIVRGLGVTQLPDTGSGEQVYSLAAGAARVSGSGIELPTDRRVTYAATPDLLWIDSEPHQSSTEASQRIDLHRWPMIGQPQVRITARRTVTIAHGGFTGAADALPDTGVIELELVKQGGTTYTAGTDYLLTAGQVDWSPAGAEPAPGSSYEVTYKYMTVAAPTDVDATGFSVSGALAGSLVLVSYDYALRRIDRLCLDPEGGLGWIKGTPAEWSPVAPHVPPHLLALASVLQYWDERRRVLPDGVRVVPMPELADYRRRIDRVVEDQAELRLAVDIQGRQSGIKKGLFADPFLSNDMRDAGQPQTAAIAHGALLLPMEISVHQLGEAVTARAAPAHGHAPLLEQPMRTGAMLVNPYSAFDPLPAAVTLIPAVDRWSESVDEWAAPITSVQESTARSGRDVETHILSETTTELQYLRPIEVRFELGFGAGETLVGVVFDGLPVTPQPLAGGTLVADGSGLLRGSFTVPAGVPAGSKLVEFTGSGGSEGSATFTGQGTLVHRELQQVTTVWRRRTDPLAQTFTLAAARQVSGVDLHFTAKGSARVLVQLRTVEGGFPTREVLAQAELQPADISLTGATRVTWPPLLLDAEREYAVVALCDDAVTALAVAELGGWDETAGRWVTSQPYQVGVLLSSSNASTWTAHQDRDMAFALLAPQYTETERVIDLGSVDVTDATDLLVQAHVFQPSPLATGEFELLLGGGQAHRVAPGQVARLDVRYTGPVQVNARLRSAQGLGAVLHPGVQLIAADLQTSGTYISPLIAGGTGVKVRVIFEAELPAGTSLLVHAQDDSGGAWTLVPFLSSSPQTAGVLEITHELTTIDAARLRVRLTLGGTHSARPVLRNLRVIVL